MVGQVIHSVDSIRITKEFQFPYHIIRDEIILPQSFSIFPKDSTLRLIFDSDQKALTIDGTDLFFRNFPDSVIWVTYRFFPFSIQSEYKRYSLGKITNEGTRVVERSDISTKTSALDQFFDDSKLNKSGSFVRGVSIGSNQDLTLNSGFRLQVDGQINEDVEISAVLTDESSPIQPEGNTQTLQELDKVYIQIKSENYETVLGDFVMTESGTDFLNYSRKLQGIKAFAKTNYGIGKLGFASSRGKFTSNSLQGMDGNQGPYRLRGKNNEKFIIIIAGTERVFLNGQLMSRGETQDYIIDYSAGEISFTANRLITSASRITVDFEYSDRFFARDFISGEYQQAFFSDDWKFQIRFVKESDDKNRPIDVSLTDLDRQILLLAGNDPLKATKSGVDSVGYFVDGIPAGNYIRRDTLTINSGHTFYYKYLPGHPLAVYSVSFSETGPGSGKYIRKSFGYYEWSELDGTYEPIIFLPIPSSIQVLSIKNDVIILKYFTWNQEFASSDFNQNTFSELDEKNNKDVAFSNRINFTYPILFSNNEHKGKFQTEFYQRYTGTNFSSADRFREAEFNRNWALETVEKGIERQLEGMVSIEFPSVGLMKSTFGTLTQGYSQQTEKFYFQLKENLPDWVHTDYQLTKSSTNNSNLNQSVEWIQHQQNATYEYNWLRPFGHWLFEERKIAKTDTDSVISGSFSASAYTLGTGIFLEQGNISFSGSYRQDSQPQNGELILSSEAYTQMIDASFSPASYYDSKLQFTKYEKYYTSIFREIGNSNSSSLLLRWHNRFSPLERSIEIDQIYSINTQQSSKLDRVFLKVPIGLGNYIWIDRNGNGIQEVEEFEPTRFNDGEYILRTFPGEELEPIVDISLQFRVRLKPYLATSKWTYFPNWFTNYLSLETYLTIDEKSKNPNVNDLYFLNLSTFLDRNYTLSGNQQIIQDIWINERSIHQQHRFRLIFRRSQIQYALDVEKRSFTEQSLRSLFRFTNEWFGQTDVGTTFSQFESSSIFRPSYQIRSLFFSPDISFRSGYIWEVGLKSFFDYRKNLLTTNDSFFTWSETLRYIYSFTGKGRFRSELEFTQTKQLEGSETSFIPFEFTNGNPIGKLFVGRMSFDYRISTYINSFVSYDLRLINDNQPIHLFKAEIRAFF